MVEMSRAVDMAAPSGTGTLPGDGWPVLGAEALYGLAGEIVAVLEPHTEADPAALLVSLLVEFGALIGSGPHAVAGSAQHPARLFAVLVGETSKGRKGTAAQDVGRVTSRVDPDFHRERRLNGFGSGEVLVDTVRGNLESAQDARLLVLEPEFARILTTAKRDGSSLSPIIRQAWDGGRLAARSRAATAVADTSHVCILAHISADELRAKLTDTDIAGGFANRFLFVCVRRSKLLPSGGSLEDRELEDFVRKFALFARDARTVGTMTRTPAADQLWTELYYEMDSDEPGGLLAAVIGRDAPQVLRLSVAYALMDGSKSIDVAHVRAAWAVWQYCRASAAYIFGERLGDHVADELLRALRAAGDEGLDGRERHALFQGHASKKQIDTACELLVSSGVAVMETFETGGRPSIVLRATDCEQSERSEQSQWDFERDGTPVTQRDVNGLKKALAGIQVNDDRSALKKVSELVGRKLSYLKEINTDELELVHRLVAAEKNETADR